MNIWVIFVYDVSSGSKFIPLHVDIKLFHPAPLFWKDFSSHIKLSWHPCRKSIGCKCEDLFLDSQFYSVALHVYSYARTHCINYCSFEVNSEIRNCEPFNVFFFFKIFFGSSEFLEFPYEF